MKTVVVFSRIPPQLHADLVARAQREDRSLSATIRRLLMTASASKE